MSDPPDPGGGDDGPCARSSPPVFSQMDTELTHNPRKRAPTDENIPQPPRKTNIPVSSLPTQSTYVKPEYSATKVKYTAQDSAPFIVHVNKTSSDPSSGIVLRPIKFGHFLFTNKIKNVVMDGVKRVGRNRISVEFKSYSDANAFMEHPALA